MLKPVKTVLAYLPLYENRPILRGRTALVFNEPRLRRSVTYLLQMRPQYRISIFSTHAPTGDMDVFARMDRVHDLSENRVGSGEDEQECYHRPIRERHEHGQLRYAEETMLE